jgi:hypothetical protein
VRAKVGRLGVLVVFILAKVSAGTVESHSEGSTDHRNLRNLRLLSPLVSSSTLTTTTAHDHKCAAGQYQSSALVLNCDGGAGLMNMTLKKAETTSVARFPAGVHDILIGLSANVDLDVQLWDDWTHQCIVGFGCRYASPCSSPSDYCHQYAGMQIYFSGNDEHAPVIETLKVSGALTRPMHFKVRAYAPGNGSGHGLSALYE